MMENNEVVYLYLDDIIPNRFQPREVFDDQALKELAISIKEHGVIQPIIVRKVENKYEIIAGERRYKASTMAGLTKIPAIVKNLDDQESSKVALIENLQRRDLTPIEEARTYQKILELEPDMTQEQLASTMGKTQSVVSNKLRLLALPDEVQDALLKEKISERHARSLLNLANKNDQIRMLDKVITERMTVRELDKEIKEMNDNQGNGNATGGVQPAIASNLESPSVSEIPSTPVNQLGNIDINNLPINPHALFGGEIFTEEKPQMPEIKESAPEIKPMTDIFNPTAVDIDKIRANAVDINGPVTPAVDVKDLMKDTTAEVNNEFKFVPTFGSDFDKPAFSTPEVNTENNNLNSTANSANPFSFDVGGNNSNNNENNSNSLFGGSFGINSSPSTLNQDVTNIAPSQFGISSDNSTNKFFGDTQEASTNIASSISTPSFNLSAFGNPSKKDVVPAINDIKATIKEIETKGYKVLVEESDSDNSYQITIKVDKNI